MSSANICFMKKNILYLMLLFTDYHVCAQKILIVDSTQSNVSFRGLSVVSDQLFWISGSKGTIGRSLDGGSHIVWMHPAGFEQRDFRDIEAFDANTALAMAVDNPGLIIKTTDAGLTWKTVYEKNMPGMFLDAMCFKDNKRGIAIGDPINLRFWIIETNDGGNSWNEVPPPFRPVADSGEACFASSGTNIQFVNNSRFEYGFVSGGYNSKLYLMSGESGKPNAVIILELAKDLESTGANSWAVNDKSYVVVGGDFKDYKTAIYNSSFSTDAGRTWQTPAVLPSGYKSCVTWKDDTSLITTGLSGTDITGRGVASWQHISDVQFNVVQKAKNGIAIYFAGAGGRIAKYVQ